MRLLLDTHAFLWWIFDDPKLSSPARDAISHPATEVLFSVVSAWEIAIKARAGRLDLPADAARFIAGQLRANGFASLPVELEHALAVHGLPDIHKDPFDRLLAAQAQAEGLMLVTCDPHLSRYPIATHW
jgi:PIN domain nuclease of toxin-antitoxin system